MTGAEGDAHAAQERLTREARATASALLDWLGTRVDGAGPPTTGRPPQSPGPCSWCPVCALVAALRGEQPELTARLVEQASGLMMLLRLMMQAHQNPAHADPGHHHDLGDLADLADFAAARTDVDGADLHPAASHPADAVPTADAGADPTAADPHEVDPALAAVPDPDPEPPARPRGRQAPVRRESPRSAAFRRAPGPGAPPGRPASRPVPAASTEPGAAAATSSAPTPRAPRTGNAAAGSARPSVQRIPIRRPGRPDGEDGAATVPDDPC